MQRIDNKRKPKKDGLRHKMEKYTKNIDKNQKVE